MRFVPKAEALAIVERERAAIEARFGGCAMCAAIADPAGRHVLAQDDVAVCVLDRFAARPGHVVVILRRHCESIAEMPFEEYAAVQRLAWEAARALTAVMAPRRVYVASLGATARIATSFPHHHVHVIPLTDGGERDRPAEVLTWSRGVHLYEPGEAERFAEELRAAWPDRSVRF